jgi:restriction system protein
MVGVPRHDELFNPTLRALRELGGSASITELSEQIIEDLQPPQEVIEQPHPGKVNQTELEYRLAWARTYLKKYGLITNSTRGVMGSYARGC